MTSLFPDICTEDLARSRDFYRELLGFAVIFENAWYVQLQHPAQPAAQIAFVLRDHDSVPRAFRARAQGVLVTVELDDVDGCHARARALGLELAYPLVSEVWGQRHFMVADPNGLLVDVVQLIPGGGRVSDDPNLMPIGRFARAVRLSVKALRHYDEEGLLVPALVDRQTGYRYYARDQARDAVMIAMLRSLDLPLASIRAALSGSPRDLASLLARETERLGAELEQRRRALRSLERIARAGTLAPYLIAVREEPAQLVARLSGTTTPERLIEDSTAWVFEVMDEIARAGRPAQMPVLCINEPPDAEGRLLVHACASLSPPTPRFARAKAFELPAATCAWTLHRGSYDELGLAHHALFAWAQERGHDAHGAIREIYLNDPNEVEEDALETEVLLPLEETGGRAAREA